MPGQHGPDFPDRSANTVGKLLLTKAMVHCGRDVLPELIATSFVNGLVANDRKFMNTRRDKN